MRILIALGGNAIIPAGERGTWTEQQANVRVVASAVAALRRDGHEVIVTHGNGPQVGALALQQACAGAEVPALPLDVLVAMTQGQIGYLLQQAIGVLEPRLPTATMLTRARVAADDPAFSAPPTKPIGPFYDEAEARRRAAADGWIVGPDAGRGWRRMVASPQPVEVVEHAQIAALADDGVVVIAGGGGGVPVVDRGGTLHGVEAVIDKDRCAAELALAVGAEALILTTGVACAAFDYGTRWQRDLARLTVSDALRHLRSGDFPAGSMGPKVEAAVRFVRAAGRAAITDPDHVVDALAERAGTWVVRDEDGPSRVAQGQLAG